MVWILCMGHGFDENPCQVLEAMGDGNHSPLVQISPCSFSLYRTKLYCKLILILSRDFSFYFSIEKNILKFHFISSQLVFFSSICLVLEK